VKQINKYKKDSKEIIALTLNYLAEDNKFSFLTTFEIFLDLYLVDDKKIEKVNAQFRGKAEPTNVLSFAYLTGEDFNTAPNPLYLGEIFISMETLVRESLEQNITEEQHYVRLLIHGLLHLLGFDHNVEIEARLMYNTEENILHKLKLSTNSIVANYWR
jgi:probable rRNA maturation factor